MSSTSYDDLVEDTLFDAVGIRQYAGAMMRWQRERQDVEAMVPVLLEKDRPEREAYCMNVLDPLFTAINNRPAAIPLTIAHETLASVLTDEDDLTLTEALDMVPDAVAVLDEVDELEQYLTMVKLAWTLGVDCFHSMLCLLQTLVLNVKHRDFDRVFSHSPEMYSVLEEIAAYSNYGDLESETGRNARTVAQELLDKIECAEECAEEDQGKAHMHSAESARDSGAAAGLGVTH
ncbi:hypothetical protein KIPB_003727 [Kipferlia bialata]|uniref:Uncharacterized protein n=1 Tax=Kipferlia bialata TaxID=797122 RepID=A0A9K3CUB9_9EUKA|nr:hypothetical protein KIPB_002223 [Kipferlia bialata]GIQ82565.1 hypothetical protein KIPB_003727 [Kipferlia bialata]|eukprot:g2223.t1